MLLSKEDVDAVNRLLVWRTETIAEGHEASVELRTSAKGDFVATCLRGTHDEIHKYAYGATIPAAVDAVLELVAVAVDEENAERRTEPGHPAPTLPPDAGEDPSWTPLAELMS